mgnify:CR=1 FL=1
MRFTDIFIRRPVLATVINLLILLMGLQAFGMLDVRQYPETQKTVVTVTTPYPGASAEQIQGFITTPLQQAIAEAEGIDYISATSKQGASTIKVHMRLNVESSTAASNIQAKVASQSNALPGGALDPVITTSTGGNALMYIPIYSETVPRSRITDYVKRVVQPRIQAVAGVGKAGVHGQPFAMRLWLKPDRMAALGVTPADVNKVLEANNALAPAGNTKGRYVRVNLKADTLAADVEDFRNLVVREDDGALVRLRDVAHIELGGAAYDTTAWFKGRTAVVIAVNKAPGSNPLTVANRVRDVLPGIRAALPANMKINLAYDASAFISESITEVYKTLGEALLIVLTVIFLALGSGRAAVIPAVAVPLSMIGAGFIMYVLGFSVNLLTLLSMVLAIGLVVDDAIIVVENIHRHIEEGHTKHAAAIQGARELVGPIVAMTVTLLAVYAPIGFMGGLVGKLFTEFAFTLAGAVLISGVVALTLSPMLSGTVLNDSGHSGRFERWVEHVFDALSRGYRRVLAASLQTVSVGVIFGVLVLGASYAMFTMSQSEMAPKEDEGILFFQGTGPRTATIDYMKQYARQLQTIFEEEDPYSASFMLMGRGGTNAMFGGMKFKDRDKRNVNVLDYKARLQKLTKGVAGLDMAVFAPAPLPGTGGGLPVQFVLTGQQDFDKLTGLADRIIGRAMKSGNFLFLKKNVEMDRPLTTIRVDRDRAGDLGITMADIGGALGTMLGTGYVNRFAMEGRSYKVIPQVARSERLTPAMLKDYRLRTDSGKMVSLANLVTLEKGVGPSSRTQFQQLNAVTLQGVPKPGVPLGSALGFLERQTRELAPGSVGMDYKGQARQFAKEGSSLVKVFFLSLVVIYLVLAGLYESWRDPLIILVSVPMSLFGAMAFIMLGATTLNIYSQVGLITLIGVVAKNGILIVEFANQVQRERGLDRKRAVVEAGAIRLRPILMTTAALIMAMVPLLIATGAGAASRFAIGLTIAAGLGVGTLFTLFVVPAFYALLARDHAGLAGGEG